MSQYLANNSKTYFCNRSTNKKLVRFFSVLIYDHQLNCLFLNRGYYYCESIYIYNYLLGYDDIRKLY